MNFLAGIEYRILKDVNSKKNFEGIEYDSRKIKENFIFVALTGTNVDGHDYIDEAVKRGATCVLVSKNVELKHHVTYILIENLRENLGIIASNFFNWPQKKLKIIGITGTNGKTSSTYMLEKLLPTTNITRIGTIEYKVGNEIFEAVNTTPESLDLIKIFYHSLEKNIDTVIMEVSSHSLELGRVEMIDFDYALFTNLTQDHLDYHKNMENYYLAKRKLFYKLKDSNNCVINIDDNYGKKLYDELITLNRKPLSYSLNDGDLTLKISSSNDLSINYLGLNFEVKFNLLGKFNLYNLLGVVGLALKMGLKIENIVAKIPNIKATSGRFENVNCGQEYNVIVDYAHTPDALKNILISARDVKNTKRLITVFGCGGNRDSSKRPIMAKIAEELSDVVILTSDNPRNEDPNIIFSDIKRGFNSENQHLFFENREEAIKTAINMAQKNDIIIIAGKGHETYQIIKDKKFHFDDREIARREIIKRRLKENSVN